MRRSHLLTLAFLVACGKPQEAPVSAAVQEARKLLAEAGFPGGKGFPKLQLLYNTNETTKKLYAAIQEMWRKNLGVEIELRNIEWKVYLDRLTQVDYQIARRRWLGDYRDPNTFIDMFTSSSGNNNTNWKDPEFDKLVQEAGAESNPKKRFELLRKAERRLMDELPVVPLFFNVSHNMWKPTVKGIYDNTIDMHPLNEVEVTGRDILRIDNGAEPQTLDPSLMRGVPEARIAMCLFEGLTGIEPKTFDPIPGAAERWELSADQKTYTFHLRESRWSDGKPVTAEDFVYAIRRILDPNLATDYDYQVHYVKNGKAFKEKKISDATQIGARATDAKTLVIELDNPCPYFLELGSFFTYYPLRKDVVEKHADRWTRPENIVGNGPFVLKEWKQNDRILLEKSRTYWSRDRVKLKQVEFQPVESVATSLTRYEKDQCDWMTAVPLEHIEELKKRPDYHSTTILDVAFFSCNVSVPPLNNPKVRRALGLAIDREVICERILRGGEIPAYSITPDAFSGYKPPRFNE